MLREEIKVLNLLLAVQNPPALDAQELAVRFLLNGLKLVEK